MNRLLLSTLSVALLGAFAAGSAIANDPERSSIQGQVGDQEIYGSQLMTPDERAAHRAQMQSARTSAERERLRVEHQAAMQSRAKERGISLPDDSSVGRVPGSGTDVDGPR